MIAPFINKSIAKGTRKVPLDKKYYYTHNGCLDLALRKIGRTLQEIKEDIKKEKALEAKILDIHYNEKISPLRIAKRLNIKESEVKHFIRMDEQNFGLSYRKMAQKYEKK